MLRILIIGFGNPLRSDDGLGWHVAQSLSHELSLRDVQVVAAHQLTPEMAEAASRAEQVLFIDAACEGAPGTLNCAQVFPAESAGPHSHDLTPAVVLRLAKELYDRCPEASLFTVVGENFETGESMSPAVRAAIPELVAEIRNRVESSFRT